MIYYSGLYFLFQVWSFKTVLLQWALFLFSYLLFFRWFTTVGSISVFKFDHLKQFYYSGLYFLFQVWSFKTVLLQWALFLRSYLLFFRWFTAVGSISFIIFDDLEEFYYTGHLWALLGSPGRTWAPLGAPGLPWAPLGSI